MNYMPVTLIPGCTCCDLMRLLCDSFNSPFSPSLWVQTAAVTAGCSSLPAAQYRPEPWSALPPEQTHKLPANTKQPLINYPPHHNTGTTPWQPSIFQHCLPCVSPQRGTLPFSRFLLSTPTAALVDSPYLWYFGHFSLTASRSRPPAADSANVTLKSAAEEINYKLHDLLLNEEQTV